MITASFRIQCSGESSFTVKGHSGSAAKGHDIVCAAVSSAAYMAANTITEVLKVKAAADVKDGYLHFAAAENDAARDVLKGLRLHLEGLSTQYPDYIKVTTEV